MRKISVLSLGLILVFLISCENSIRTPLNIPIDPTKSAMKATLSDIQATVLDNKCATSGCHVKDGSFPDLTKGITYSALVGVQSNYDSLLVQPGNASGSVFYLKLLGDKSVGGVMPKGFSALSQAQKDSVKVWINNGAKNN